MIYTATVLPMDFFGLNIPSSFPGATKCKFPPIKTFLIFPRCAKKENIPV